MTSDVVENVPSPSRVPPILFIHGTFGRAELMRPWAGYFEAEGFECHLASLPGRDPTDRDVLRKLSMSDCMDSVLATRNEISEPPIVVGHSMGGLIAQKLAAQTPTAALVLLSSAPPGVLWAQPRALPHLVRLLPRILAGRPLLPSPATLRAIVFHDLADKEQRELIPQLVPDSGRAFRTLILGQNRFPADRVTCPVLSIGGDADRNVSPGIARSIAKRYGAEHHTFPGKGHWIIAPSRVPEVAPTVLRWLHKTFPSSRPV